MSSIIFWIISVSAILIGFTLWVVLTFSSRRSSLKFAAATRFAIVLGAYLFLWIALAFVLGSAGVLQATATRALPSLGLTITLPIILGTLFLYRSATLRAVVEVVPLPWLIGIQFYRTLGLIFLVLYWRGYLPGEFALPAGWGDIVVGLSAPVIAYSLYKGHRWSYSAALGWNLFGILDFVVAVATGFLSSPGPVQILALDEPNEMITAFPLNIVPLFVVPLSIL
ncbi:MAG TPA: hypothetical protein VF074_01595, partial [Pyrinomonadaceae bacterium]